MEVSDDASGAEGKESVWDVINPENTYGASPAFIAGVNK